MAAPTAVLAMDLEVFWRLDVRTSGRRRPLGSPGSSRSSGDDALAFSVLDAMAFMI